MVTVTLPLPPSVNRYWRSIVTKKRARAILSEEGRAYKAIAELILTAQRQKMWDCPVSVRGRVYFPNRRGDLDNRIKPVLDALQGFAYENDSQVWELLFTREIDKDNPRVEVEVTPEFIVAHAT